jgi:hypothetical protein
MVMLNVMIIYCYTKCGYADCCIMLTAIMSDVVLLPGVTFAGSDITCICYTRLEIILAKENSSVRLASS